MTSGPVAEWWLDRSSAVPLYVQLRTLIHEQISNGRLRERTQLPGVMELAAALEVNFETVRKAYKELEQEGLLQMMRGRGTFVADGAGSRIPAERRLELIERSRTMVSEFIDLGLEEADIRAILDVAIKQECSQGLIIATECNQPEVDQVADALRRHIGMPVKGVLLPALRAEVMEARKRRNLAGVVTTGFHINEVRERLQGLSIPVDSVVTSMSPETRRAIEAFPKNGRFGFFCRDAESIPFYQSVLAAELGVETSIRGAIIGDPEGMTRLLADLDVALTSPTVFQKVKEVAPEGVAVFNVLDRIDPMSLRALRERFTPGKSADAFASKTGRHDF